MQEGHSHMINTLLVLAVFFLPLVVDIGMYFTPGGVFFKKIN